MQPIGYQSGILAGILPPRAKKRYMLHLMDDPETQAFPSPDVVLGVLNVNFPDEETLSPQTEHRYPVLPHRYTQALDPHCTDSKEANPTKYLRPVQT